MCGGSLSVMKTISLLLRYLPLLSLCGQLASVLILLISMYQVAPCFLWVMTLAKHGVKRLSHLKLIFPCWDGTCSTHQRTLSLLHSSETTLPCGQMFTNQTVMERTSLNLFVTLGKFIISVFLTDFDVIPLLIDTLTSLDSTQLMEFMLQTNSKWMRALYPVKILMSRPKSHLIREQHGKIWGLLRQNLMERHITVHLFVLPTLSLVLIIKYLCFVCRNMAAHFISTGTLQDPLAGSTQHQKHWALCLRMEMLVHAWAIITMISMLISRWMVHICLKYISDELYST